MKRRTCPIFLAVTAASLSAPIPVLADAESAPCVVGDTATVADAREYSAIWSPPFKTLRTAHFVAAVAGSSESHRRTEEDNRRLVTAAFDRWAKGGTSFFEDVLAPNVVWRIEGSSSSAGVFRGRAEFMEKAVRPFTSRLATSVRPINVRIFADGDHVIAHWEGRATARDGMEYRNRYAWIFRMQDGKAVEAWAFLDLAPYDDVLRRIPAPEEQTMETHPYVGMWVTDDGHVRHELLPNGRYDEARGRRQSAYQGRYEITGTHIEYWDDTGFTADGDFVDENTLHHGGMIFRRR